MAPRVEALLCLLASFGLRASCEYTNASALAMQVDTMLAEYDRDAPPSAPVRLNVTLDVRHATVHEGQSAMRMLADLKMTWDDPRIGWNATEWGTDNALTSAERLWLPDVVLLNAAASVDVGDDAMRARITAGGAVSWISRVDVTAPLAMDLVEWPRDTHACTYKFGSRAYGVDELQLVSDFKHAVVFESGAWEILSVSGSQARWSRGAEQTSVAAWTVRVARRAPAQAAAAGAALLAAALQLLAAAALPAARRHALAACASFTAALWLAASLGRVPGGRACPRVVSVMCAVCACGAATSAAAALVARVARRSGPPPAPLRAVLSRLSVVCRLTPSPDDSVCSSSGAWAATALVLDRVLVAALLLTLLVLLAVQFL